MQDSAIEQFIHRLAEHKPRTGYYNPYHGAEQRHNLKVYLTQIAESESQPALIVGEAPGYKGCRLTGIPFSSSDLIARPRHQFWQELAPRLKITTIEKENTAGIVWDLLQEIGAMPLFWNAFPFHPYERYKPKSNRQPNEREMKIGLPYLQQLADIFEISTVIGLGRRGQLQAQRCFPGKTITYVRHPSYGGKSDFVSKMGEIFC